MNRLLTLLLTLLVVPVYGQQQYTTELISAEGKHPQEWETYLDNPTFTIEYKYVDCDPNMGYDKEMVLLKITNKSRDFLAFDWHMDLYYSEDCKTCDYYDEYHYVVNVNPESSEEGDCDMYSDYQMKIFSAFIDTNYSQGDKLISFKLSDLTVTSVTID